MHDLAGHFALPPGGWAYILWQAPNSSKWPYDDRAPPDGVVILAEDITEGVVYENRGVKITAFEVDHAPVKPAFGYRIDYSGHSVVVSGDTRISENLIRHAQNVDLLIHNVVSPETFQRLGVPAERTANILPLHTTPEQAGEVFARTNPKLAVYSHIVQTPPSKM